MNCKEAQREVNSFLEEELEPKKRKGFLEHMETCPSCREELTIQYLLEKGLERLEEGNNLDLTKELENKMEAAKRKVRIYDTVKNGMVFLGIVILACIFIFCLVQVIV